MSTFGDRLREERERLKHSRDGFASLTSISKQSLWTYEQGVVQPKSAYLARLDIVGVDLLYLLTGRRKASQELTGEELLEREKLAPTEAERLLLVRLRAASDQLRGAVFKMFGIE